MPKVVESTILRRSGGEVWRSGRILDIRRREERVSERDDGKTSEVAFNADAIKSAYIGHLMTSTSTIRYCYQFVSRSVVYGSDAVFRKLRES